MSAFISFYPYGKNHKIEVLFDAILYLSPNQDNIATCHVHLTGGTVLLVCGAVETIKHRIDTEMNALS